MRDYKNVKVPRKYRSGAGRSTVQRVSAGPASRPRGRKASGFFLNVLLALAVAGCCWLAWQAYGVLTEAEMFQVAGVDVKGVHELSNAELKNMVGPFTGQNIFRVDLDAAVRRANANPWIKQIRIHRSLPNRITMHIVERTPYALLETGAGRYLMDQEAVVLERVKNDRAAGRPLPVVIMTEERPRPGEPVTTGGISQALTLLAEIEARGGWNLAQVTVKAASPDSLSLVYADHEFRIGSGRYAEKLRRLAEVMSDVKQRNLVVAYVDLRPENQAAVMVKTTNAGKGKAKISNNKHQKSNKHQ